MIPDIANVYGHYRPRWWAAALVTFAQAQPRNWLGQQFAQVARKLVLAFSRLPIDLAVGPIRMRCYLRDNNSERKFVFMPWRFDRLERELIARELPRDGVFVDIGANVGIYSLCAGTGLDAAGRIAAFEPNPPAFDRLRFNLEATRANSREWPRVDVLPVGISDTEGEFELSLDAGNLGGSSLSIDHRAGGTVRVRCRPLLAVLGELGIDRVDVLKIDIEGAEDRALLPFLAGAPASLLPRWIVIENSEHLWREDLPGAIRASGYEVAIRTRMNTVYRLASSSA
jgi:FkbM family methyltransferase